MTTDRGRIARVVAACIWSVLLGWTAPAADDTADAPAQPPVLTAMPPRPQRADAVLPIDVRIEHPVGIERAVLWYLGQHDTVFRPYPMRRVDGDVFTARLGPWNSRGNEVRYYVEAWDSTGTQRAALGDRGAPFVVALTQAPSTSGSWVGWSAIWYGLLGAVLLGALWCGVRVRRRLPPPAPARDLGPDLVRSVPRAIPIVLRAAGSMPTETIYLQMDGDDSGGGTELVASAEMLRRARNRHKSRLAYRKQPGDE